MRNTATKSNGRSKLKPAYPPEFLAAIPSPICWRPAICCSILRDCWSFVWKLASRLSIALFVASKSRREVQPKSKSSYQQKQEKVADAIADPANAGKSAAKIAEEIGAPKSTVKDAQKKAKKDGLATVAIPSSPETSETQEKPQSEPEPHPERASDTRSSRGERLARPTTPPPTSPPDASPPERPGSERVAPPPFHIPAIASRLAPRRSPCRRG